MLKLKNILNESSQSVVTIRSNKDEDVHRALALLAKHGIKAFTGSRSQSDIILEPKDVQKAKDLLTKFKLMETMNEDTQRDADWIYKKWIKGAKTIPTATSIAYDIKMEDGKISASYIKHILKKYKNIDIPLNK